MKCVVNRHLCVILPQKKAEDDMKGITFGPAGGRSLSRMQGTKVTLAGRTAFLPNADVPFVLQRLTMGQIEAIPRDRFSVSLVELPMPLAMAGIGRKGPGGVTGRGLKRMKGLPRFGERSGATGFIRKPSGATTVEIDGTKQYTAMVGLIDQIRKTTDSFYDVSQAQPQPTQQST